MYKCLCAAITQDQVDELVMLGIHLDLVYDILKVGKDCGTCIGSENDFKHKESKVKDDETA